MIEKREKSMKYKVTLNSNIYIPRILVCVDDIILHRKTVFDTITYCITLLL